MPEETSPLPKSIPPPVVESTPSGASADARALNDLRKEVVEARNLVIKTDNLLKNMHAELKKFSVQQDEFRKSRMWSSAGAYGLFALICVLGAVFFAQSQGSHEREAAKAAEERARLEVQKAEVAQKQLKDKADASERALHIYDSLSSEKEGSGLTAAIANAARYERKQLSTLESKAIDDKLMLLRERLSSAALEKGQSAFRRGDHKATSEELGRYLELVPNANDPQLWFHLGFARAQLKDQPGVIEPMEKFLKAQSQGKLAQTAGYYLGVAYEETNQPAKAKDAFEKANSLFPGSELAPLIRQHLRKIAQAQGANAGTPPAANPAPAPRQQQTGGLTPPSAPPTR